MTSSTFTPAILVFFLLSGSILFALDPTKAITQYVQDVWTSDHGLPQNTVNSIVQSRDGYLWLATFEGLVRFDGVQFTVHDKKNVPVLKSNQISRLLEVRDGSLWVATLQRAYTG